MNTTDLTFNISPSTNTTIRSGEFWLFPFQIMQEPPLFNVE